MEKWYGIKRENGLRQARAATGCVMCGFGCHLEKEPNRIQRLRCSKNPVHRRMCEGILKIENHGVTYEEALQRCHIATTIEEILLDSEDKGRAA